MEQVYYKVVLGHRTYKKLSLGSHDEMRSLADELAKSYPNTKIKFRVFIFDSNHECNPRNGLCILRHNVSQHIYTTYHWTNPLAAEIEKDPTK